MKQLGIFSGHNIVIGLGLILLISGILVGVSMNAFISVSIWVLFVVSLILCGLNIALLYYKYKSQKEAFFNKEETKKFAAWFIYTNVVAYLINVYFQVSTVSLSIIIWSISLLLFFSLFNLKSD